MGRATMVVAPLVLAAGALIVFAFPFGARSPERGAEEMRVQGRGRPDGSVPTLAGESA